MHMQYNLSQVLFVRLFHQFYFRLLYALRSLFPFQLLQGVSERMIFKLALITLFYVRMHINSTKSESPHYDI